jgi:hypothetical protein
MDLGLGIRVIRFPGEQCGDHERREDCGNVSAGCGSWRSAHCSISGAETVGRKVLSSDCASQRIWQSAKCSRQIGMPGHFTSAGVRTTKYNAQRGFRFVHAGGAARLNGRSRLPNNSLTLENAASSLIANTITKPVARSMRVKLVGPYPLI